MVKRHKSFDCYNPDFISRPPLSVTNASPIVRGQPTPSLLPPPISGESILSGNSACRPCDTFNLNMSPLCNLSSPRYHQGACLAPPSWGPPQGWAHLLSQDYNGNLPSYIRSKQKPYNCQEPNGESGCNEEEVHQLFQRRTGASHCKKEGSPPS